MLMVGKFIVKASIQKAWDNLLNPETLATCIPGCEKMETIDEKTYHSVVKQKVGPISVRFRFTTTLTEITPPTHMKAVGKGEDVGRAGNFSQETTVDLEKISGEEVEVTYKTDVAIVGRLATFGNRIMSAKAKSVEQQFTQALQEKLASEGS